MYLLDSGIIQGTNITMPIWKRSTNYFSIVWNEKYIFSTTISRKNVFLIRFYLILGQWNFILDSRQRIHTYLCTYLTKQNPGKCFPIAEVLDQPGLIYAAEIIIIKNWQTFFGIKEQSKRFIYGTYSWISWEC